MQATTKNYFIYSLAFLFNCLHQNLSFLGSSFKLKSINQLSTGGKEKQNISYKGMKTVKLTVICNGSKWTMSVNDGLGLLQIVSELVIGKCETLVGVGLDAF